VEEIDAVIEGLRTMPAPSLDPAFAAAVRHRARAALERAPRPAAAAVGVPLLATSAVAVYLGWLVAFLAALGS
jgi:hypothetical protein